MASKRDRRIKGNQNRKEKGTDGISIRRFIVTYVVLMLAFFFFNWFKPIHNVIDVNELYTQSVVIVTSKILGVLGVPFTSQGSIIALPSLSLDVQFGCNGIEAVMIYSIAVLAYPAHWKKKIVGILAGVFILQTANILRIVLLVYSGLHFKSLFDYIHIYVAQGMMIALSLAVFFIYLNHAKTSKTAHS
jgi:exosortase H (IPTLxxWG-CTERM-specific)